MILTSITDSSPWWLSTQPTWLIYAAERRPPHYWKTTTVTAGLRLSESAAPFVLDGPNKRDASQDHVDRVLVPELTPSDSAVMD
ncbi:hypothetical protein ASF32_23790 [Methylobacterium sp. Leaf91]|nr:hypothetical protein ASF32_23790 [Methylobacterium sp. Leaf91]